MIAPPDFSPPPARPFTNPPMRPFTKKRRSKYGNRKTVIDGITFDSAAEARRYGELKLLQRAGKITALQCHLPISLKVNGIVVCKYIADFVYLDPKNCRDTYEDVKGVRTAVYRLKKKLMKAIYGIDITEIDA